MYRLNSTSVFNMSQIVQGYILEVAIEKEKKKYKDHSMI